MIESKETLSLEGRRVIRIAYFIQKYAIFLIFAVLLLFSFIATNGVTLELRNIMNIIVQNSPVVLIAMGVTMVIISGGIDLSLGSVIALSAVGTAGFARIAEDGSSLPFIVPLVTGLLIGSLCGFVNGLFITKTRIPPFIATLGMMTSARGLSLVLTKVYSETGSISNLHPAMKFIGQGKILGIDTPIWILLLMAVISYVVLKYTRMGRYAYAIGGNARAAQVSGINSDKYLVMIYTYAGFLAGAAGIVLTGILNSAQPTLGVLYELDAIASSVIGGTSLSGGVGTIPGAVVGGFFVGVLKNTMDLRFLSAYWQDVARGIVIVVAVVMDVRKQYLTRR